jgi:hypothetical protein
MIARKVTDYNIIKEYNSTCFCEEIRKAIYNGWHPEGQFQYVDKEYHQVMVKYEEAE